MTQAYNFALGQPEEQLKYKQAWSVKPTKKSCRGLALDEAGDTLYSVGKEKSLQYVCLSCVAHSLSNWLTLWSPPPSSVLDVKTGEIISSIKGAHE